MDEVVKRLQKPLDFWGGTDYPHFKFTFTKTDYEALFIYINHLNNHGEIHQAIVLYQKILEGLNNIENSTFIVPIFHISIEKMLLKSIESSIVQYKYSNAIQDKNKKCN